MKPKIIGTIRRNCQICRQEADCNVIATKKEIKVKCDECLGLKFP